MLFLNTSESNLRNLPPSSDGLNRHIQRSAYVSGWIWGASLEMDSSIPSPTEWGWKLYEDKMFDPDCCSRNELKIQD